MEKVDCDHLRCPICFEFPEQEVYQCKNGHPICKRCSSGLQHCPHCRVQYETVRIRNRVLETLLETLTMECTYKKEGCVVITSRRDLANHVNGCEFRPVQFCKAIGIHKCQFASTNPSKVFQHILEKHRSKQLVGPKDLMVWRNFGSFVDSKVTRNRFRTTTWEAEFENQNGIEKFLMTMMLNVHRDDFSIACIYMGNSTKDVSNYVVNIGIADSTKKVVNWRWIGTPSKFNNVSKVVGSPPFRVPIPYLINNVGGSRKDFDLILEVSIIEKGSAGLDQWTHFETTMSKSTACSELRMNSLNSEPSNDWKNKYNPSRPLGALPVSLKSKEETSQNRSLKNIALFAVILFIILYIVVFKTSYFIFIVLLMYCLRIVLS